MVFSCIGIAPLATVEEPAVEAVELAASAASSAATADGSEVFVPFYR